MDEPLFLAIAALVTPIALIVAVVAVFELILERKAHRAAALTPIVGVVLPREEEK
jgi:hypothetical protein